MSLPSETPLARFLFSGEVTKGGTVKPAGFMPRWIEGTGRFELSTFDIEAMPKQTVFEIAQDVESARGRTCRGWAVLEVGGYLAAGLEVDPDDDPPRHVNVLGWPPEKERQKLVAQRVVAELEERGGTFEPRP